MDMNLQKLTFKILGPLAKPDNEESKEPLGPMAKVVIVHDLNKPF